VQKPVSLWRNEILFRKHLYGVGNDVKQTQNTETEDIRPIGANSILHYGTLLALKPGKNRSYAHYDTDHEEDLA